ncbi:Bifunctional purine biosynthetic protein ADE1 [Candida viswanathii]|uniref:Phosphoribosylformylglycinamidine cyclo-ligase n=1 Tax=Candida viswanathii TaxID=5486 RepID=A0A367XR75_9ASCO|nr:Bifunctional purine biosynthetic protein ADE1 [Candida viswanathii]
MSLNILVIGNGGREHAIVWRLLQSPTVEHIYVAPGNGGTISESSSSKITNVPISSSPKDFDKLQKFAVEKKVNLAAKMEGSKAFSKEFMDKHNIPTARFQNFTDVNKAKEHIESVDYKIVLKADGIAAGKGVLIPETKEEALQGLNEIMVDKNFGDAGDEIVIEEFLEGDELSILTITDAPIATQEVLKKINDQIIKPTIDGMRQDGFPIFGDPETQTVLPLLSDETDLAQVMLAAAQHRLDSVTIGTKPLYSTTVVMAAGGYPEAYGKGDEITSRSHCHKTLHLPRGTALNDEGKIVTAGGRAYVGVDEHVSFNKKYNRRDIAHRAFRDADKSAAAGGVTYADSGVSVDNGNLFVENIKAMVKSTSRSGADSDIGGFGGLFDLKAAGYNTDDTLLVAATDGVGTKLRVAQIMNIHNTVGIDLVAMNVNDLVVQGAEPLMFLDYFATGKLDIQIAAQFVEVLPTVVNKLAVPWLVVKLQKCQMQSGNVLIGLRSDGLHSNGFSLVRKIIEISDYEYQSPAPWKQGSTIGEEVLVPTKIYVKQLLPSINQGLLLGLAHITGGGLVENIPRALPKHLQAKIDMNNWEVPEIFKWFGKQGKVPYSDILKTFNLGIGMVLIVAKENADKV